VRFALVRSPIEGLPDFVQSLDCWLGWAWSTENPGKLVLLAFCSQLCLTVWNDDVETAGA
jgi:hypothetical protein